MAPVGDALTLVIDPGQVARADRVGRRLTAALLMLLMVGALVGCSPEPHDPRLDDHAGRPALEAVEPSSSAIRQLALGTGGSRERDVDSSVLAQLGLELWGAGLLNEAQSVFARLTLLGPASDPLTVEAEIARAEIDLELGRVASIEGAIDEIRPRIASGIASGSEVAAARGARLELLLARARLARLDSLATVADLEARLKQAEARSGAQFWTRLGRADLVGSWAERGHCDRAHESALDLSPDAFDQDPRPGSGVAWRIRYLVAVSPCLEPAELDDRWSALDSELADARGLFAVARLLIALARFEARAMLGDSSDASGVDMPVDMSVDMRALIEEIRGTLGDGHRWRWRAELALLRRRASSWRASDEPGQLARGVAIESEARELLANVRGMLDVVDPIVVETQLVLARVLARSGEWRAAVDVLRRARDDLEERGEGVGPRALEVELRLSVAHLVLGEAQVVWDDLSVASAEMRTAGKAVGKSDTEPAWLRHVDAAATLALIELERFSEAERRLLDDVVAAERDARVRDLELSHARLTHLYQRWGQPQSAVRHWAHVSARLRDRLELEGLSALVLP